MSEPLPAYSAVVATYCREERLAGTLRTLHGQTHRPTLVVIVDASPDEASAEVAQQWAARLPIAYEKAEITSAAQQRNQGARQVQTPFIAFMDDDVEIEPDTMAQLAASLESKGRDAAGVAARMRGFGHKKPRGLLWGYYRLQAGYAHPHYGARVFGAGVNCLPCYEEESEALIAGEWLASTLVLYRSAVFFTEQFPNFTGYSFMEDVWLSRRLAGKFSLWWHASAWYEHFPSISPAKKDRRALAAMRIRHQRLLAKEVLGLSVWQARWKFWLHKLFLAAVLLRARPAGWKEEMAASWQA